jgi:hypothetical protein
VSVIDCCTRESPDGIFRCAVGAKTPSMRSSNRCFRRPFWEPPRRADVDDRQRNAVHFDAFSGNACADGHHAPPNRVSSSVRQPAASLSLQLEEEEVWVHEHRSTYEACASIGKWIAEYKHHSPKSAQSHAPRGAPNPASYTTSQQPIYPEVPYSAIIQKKRSMTRMCISLSWRD